MKVTILLVSLGGFQIALSCSGIVKLQPFAASAKSLQSCLTLCNPIDNSPPGSAVPGILQARTLEWVTNTQRPETSTGQRMKEPDQK